MSEHVDTAALLQALRELDPGDVRQWLVTPETGAVKLCLTAVAFTRFRKRWRALEEEADHAAR